MKIRQSRILALHLQHARAPSVSHRPAECVVQRCKMQGWLPTSLRRGQGIRLHSAVSNPSAGMKVTDGKIRDDMFVRRDRTTGRLKWQQLQVTITIQANQVLVRRAQHTWQLINEKTYSICSKHRSTKHLNTHILKQIRLIEALRVEMVA